MPARAITCGAALVMSMPRTRTAPRRGRVSPISDRSNVVLPIPLRPSRPTVSPGQRHVEKQELWRSIQCHRYFELTSFAVAKRLGEGVATLVEPHQPEGARGTLVHCAAGSSRPEETH